MAFELHTPICDLLGCEHPVVLAGMGGVARSELVIAVTEAGGFSFLGMVREPPELIRAEVGRIRARTSRDFGVNVIPAGTDPALLDAQIAACIEARVPVVALFWDLQVEIVRRLTGEGILVVCQIGSLREAVEAQAAGAQALIAQGWEAGGHVRGRTGLASLVADVVARVEVPVLAAGGIVDGVGLAAALTLGAQGAIVGTAFLATHESFAHDYHKKKIIEARSDETLYTEAFHINWPKGAPVRVLPNSVTRGERGDPFSGARTVIGEEEGRPIYLFSTDSPLRSMTGDFEAMALYAGQGAGRINSIVPAGDRLRAIVSQATAILNADRSRRRSEDVANEQSSPVCVVAEADDRYMGYANRDELLGFLNELLEAERAGARLAIRMSISAANAGAKNLATVIYRDEAHWCGVLAKAIRNLDATPSNRVGTFYDKAMAIADVMERLAFLNRGQGWVVRKLRDMLPKIRNDELHAALGEMLRRHEANIVLVNSTLPRTPSMPA